MRVSFLCACLLLTAWLAACSPKVQDSAAAGAASRALQGAPDGTLVVAVNGEVVTTPVLDAFARNRGLDLSIPEQRSRAVDALVESIVLAQAALQDATVNNDEAQAEIALARLLQLSARYVGHLRESIQISEQQLRDYYQQEAQRAGSTEFHIAHILFAEESAASEAARRAAQPGVDFAAMMSEYAEAGALQARDLGWGNLAQMPEAFPEVLRQLQDGQVAPVAVQSAYGWHVLQRVASRPFDPPTFEAVREGARAQLVERAIGDRVRALRSEAQVQQAAAPAE